MLTRAEVKGETKMESRNSGRRCAQKINERQCGLVLSTVPGTSSVQGKRPPKAQSAHQRPLSQIFRVLLFRQWIRPKVCVDQRPFVALFHKNARRFCASRFRLSVLVLGKSGIVVSQDGNITVVYLYFGIGHYRPDRLAR